MNLFGFDTNSVRPANPRHYGVEDRLKKSYQEIINENKYKQELNEADNSINKEIALEETARNLVNTKKLNRKIAMRQDLNLQESLTRKCLINFLSETTMHGLIFDRPFLRENQRNLRGKLNEFYEGLFTEGVLSDNTFKNSNNIFMQEAYFDIVNSVKRAIDRKNTVNIFSESIVYDILNEADKAKDLSKDIADDVKEKVTDTLEKEKKISKKKEEEKKKDKEEEEAAKSLDDDSIDKDQSDSDSDDDGSDDMGDSPDDGSDDSDSDDNPDDGSDDMGDDQSDSDGGDDEDMGDSPDDGGDDSMDDPDDSDNPDDGSDDMGDDQSDSDGGDSNGLTITVKTNGTSVSVNANKSEAGNFFIMGHQRYKERNSKTLFENLMESNLRETVKILNEQGTLNDSIINMDGILAESVMQYTMLETLYTSRLLDLSKKEILSLNKGLNFSRR
jgi:hypothetical protein